MELVAEKNACVPEDLAAHKSKFFAVRKNIETYPQKKNLIAYPFSFDLPLY